MGMTASRRAPWNAADDEHTLRPEREVTELVRNENAAPVDVDGQVEQAPTGHRSQTGGLLDGQPGPTPNLVSSMMDGTLMITGDAAADELLNTDGTALLIGMLLDQQVPMEMAFHGPATLRERLGHLDASTIAAMSEDEVVAVCCEKPAIHRFPAAMGRRIHALCGMLTSEYGGRGENVWDGRRRRETSCIGACGRLPGFGDEKSRIFVAVLGKRMGVQPDGWRARRRASSATTRRAASPTRRRPKRLPPCASGSAPRRRPASTSRTARCKPFWAAAVQTRTGRPAAVSGPDAAQIGKWTEGRPDRQPLRGDGRSRRRLVTVQRRAACGCSGPAPTTGR